MNLHPIYGGASRPGSRPARQAAVIAGALITYLTPRLAHDAKLPSLAAITEGVTDGNFAGMLPQIARRVRKATRGKLAMDADLDDLTDLLEALEGDADEESPPARENGVVEGEDDEDLLDEIKQLLRGKVDSQTMAQIDRMAGDRRRRRMGRDEPEPFSGRPRPGGTMDPIDREAWDKRARGSRPRRFGQDAAFAFEDLIPTARRIRVLG